MFVPQRKHKPLLSVVTGIALLFYMRLMFVPQRKHKPLLSVVRGIALLFYMRLMFVPQRKHKPQRPVTIALLFYMLKFVPHRRHRSPLPVTGIAFTFFTSTCYPFCTCRCKKCIVFSRLDFLLTLFISLFHASLLSHLGISLIAVLFVRWVFDCVIPLDTPVLPSTVTRPNQCIHFWDSWHILNSNVVSDCKIWGFHDGDYEEWCLLGCYAVWLLKEATFRRNLALPSSGWQPTHAAKKWATRRNIPGDTIPRIRLFTVLSILVLRSHLACVHVLVLHVGMTRKLYPW
jgi:hypothetical protein